MAHKRCCTHGEVTELQKSHQVMTWVSLLVFLVTWACTYRKTMFLSWGCFSTQDSWLQLQGGRRDPVDQTFANWPYLRGQIESFDAAVGSLAPVWLSHDKSVKSFTDELISCKEKMSTLSIQQISIALLGILTSAVFYKHKTKIKMVMWPKKQNTVDTSERQHPNTKTQMHSAKVQF